MATPITSLPAVGVDARSISDQKIYNALQELQQILTQGTTGITGDNLSTALARILGVSDSSVVRRGKSIIATTESRTNTAYGLLTTPDQVQSVVLPTDGLIFLTYQATWQESVSGAGRAAVFLGATQLKGVSSDGSGPGVQEALTNSATAAADRLLISTPMGLVSEAKNSVTNPSAYTGDVSTGQVISVSPVGTQSGVAWSTNLGTIATLGSVGGICQIYAAAGTYDISVQFKSSSGSVTAKNRRLWVWTQSFG